VPTGGVQFIIDNVPQPVQQLNSFGMAGLYVSNLAVGPHTLLAAYGLVYCYIASAPVLVFHAGRFLLKLGTTSRTRIKWLGLCLFLPVVVAIVTHVLSSSRPAAERVLYFGSFSALAAILWLQVVVVYRTLFNNTELYSFYARLAARREEAIGEIKDSYRHLREHGNSFFIVFLEGVLALVLFGATTLTPFSLGAISVTANAVVLVILVAWILPSVFVWVIATVLERRFSESAADQAAPPVGRDGPG